MSRFSQPEETMIVKNAMELTATIMLEENELRKVKAERFRSLPNAPVRTILPQPNTIYPQYPPKPKTTYSYSEFLKETIKETVGKTVGKYKKYFPFAVIGVIIVVVLLGLIKGFDYVAMLILSLGFFGVGMIPLIAFVLIALSFGLYYTKCKTLNQQLAETPEYLQAVENAEREAQRKQKEAEEAVLKEQQKLDAEYEEQKKHYETVTVPEHQKAYDRWNEIREKKIAFISEELNCNKEALKDLYDASKLISATYRELWILKWLYEDMSTSDHDIRYATELLDRDRQRLATEEAGKRTASAVHNLQGTMMSGFNAVYNAIEYGNDLQENSIEVLSKARRDSNIGNLVGTVQRHHSNKMLSSLLEKK